MECLSYFSLYNFRLDLTTFSVVSAVLKIAVCFAENVALLRTAIQSSTYSTNDASYAVDGNLHTSSCTLNIRTEPSWLAVDLITPVDVGRVCVTNDDNYNYGWLCQLFYVHCAWKLRISVWMTLLLYIKQMAADYLYHWQCILSQI